MANPELSIALLYAINMQQKFQNSPPIFNKILDLKANNIAEHKQLNKNSEI